MQTIETTAVQILFALSVLAIIIGLRKIWLTAGNSVLGALSFGVGIVMTATILWLKAYPEPASAVATASCVTFRVADDDSLFRRCELATGEVCVEKLRKPGTQPSWHSCLQKS